MKAIENLRDMLCKELEEITMKGGLTAGDLDTVDKLTHSIKSIDTIMAMENPDSYRDGGNMRDGYYDGGNYSRNYSPRGRGSYARRDSRGRYMRDSRMYRDSGKAHMVQMLQDMMEDAPDEKTRRVIDNALNQIEQ